MTTKQFPRMYTNELIPKILSNLDISTCSDEMLSSLSGDSRVIIQEQKAYISAHPPVDIFRFAAKGSQIRDGETTKIASNEVMIYLKNDVSARPAQVDDSVIYPDGTTALILTCAGKEYRFGQDQAVLTDRRRDNDDEVINTPQDSLLNIKRSGEAVSDDFLVECH
ncbi:hypothetical protein [Hafnia paralvei]|uniref:hypothetical protein n=1 Tax=Hafnia paralvei TaxID=546367 RepID=UPI002032C1E4|nr:hypothetical protein [Hafnia paralvei]